MEGYHLLYSAPSALGLFFGSAFSGPFCPGVLFASAFGVTRKNANENVCVQKLKNEPVPPGLIS
jgi:hypothetical protein